MARLNAHTCVQWIAYGAVWPVGAFDFLVVTVDEPYHSAKDEEGFILVSTSVDSLCEQPAGAAGSSRDDDEGDDSDGSEGGEHSEETGSNMDDSSNQSQFSRSSKYSRSCLRMAGYVGEPSSSGGTVLSLYIDVDVYAYIPGWLMQILAQHGLSEMLGRIRDASCLINKGVQPVPASVSKIGSMLSQIHERENKMRSLSLGNEKSIIEKGLASISLSVDKQQRAEVRDGDLASAVVSAENKSAAPSSKHDNTGNAAAPALQTDLAASYPQSAADRFSLYLGSTEDKDFTTEWTLRMTKNGILIYSSPVPNSTWLALKATVTVRAEMSALVNLLVNDKRLGEYDDMFDHCDVRRKLNIHFIFVFELIIFCSVDLPDQ